MISAVRNTWPMQSTEQLARGDFAAPLAVTKRSEGGWIEAIACGLQRRCLLSRSCNTGVSLNASVVEEHRSHVESALRTTKHVDGTACDRTRAPFAIGTHRLYVRSAISLN